MGNRRESSNLSICAKNPDGFLPTGFFIGAGGVIRKGGCEAKKQPVAVSTAVCVSASAEASRANETSAPKIPTAFCRRDFLLVQAERFEKAVAKQRNSRWLFRRPCACRRARKRAERMNHLRHNVETKKMSPAKSPKSGFFAT